MRREVLGTETEWLAVQKTCSLSIARSTAAVGKAVSTQSTESVSISVPPNCSSEKDLSKSAEIKLRSPSKKFFWGGLMCVYLMLLCHRDLFSR